MARNDKVKKPRVVATCGIIQRDGKILISQRKPMDRFGLMWEFPGGRQEPKETLKACLKRELKEELGIQANVGKKMAVVGYEYPDRSLTLHFYLCSIERGHPRALDCHAIKWITPHELAQFGFPPADRAVIDTLSKGTPGLPMKRRWFAKIFHGAD